ncbi:SRPBCC family protein [Rhodanobacter hydrolyticus]|uniref:SRPBCC family protein n=1 Tax=Rhodanobacter hydrolyticus TaxID=2250595 RepID=A0ABW8J663_9GAMM
MSGTVRLLRVFTAPPERVYRAFLDPAALAKWLPPDGFTCTVHELDARVGGRYRMSFTNFGSGNGHNFGGTYLELVPHQRIVHDDRFDDPGLPGTMVTTIVLREVGCGTEVQIEQAGIPDMIPTEQCHLGWQESLTLLERLVEPTIPG